MGAPVLTFNTTVLCMHGANAKPADFNSRVLVQKQPVVLQTSTYLVQGCPLQTVPAPFCVTAKWVTGCRRVFSNGIPLLTSNSQAICTSSGTKTMIIPTQFRVTAV